MLINLELGSPMGFPDSHIADALNAFPASGYKSLPRGRDEDSVMRRRHSLSLHPNYRMVDSCAAEFAAKTPYYYSTYEPVHHDGIDHIPNLAKSHKKRLLPLVADQYELVKVLNLIMAVFMQLWR